MDILEIAEERYYERLEEREEQNSDNENEDGNCQICEIVSNTWDNIKDYWDDE